MFGNKFGHHKNVECGLLWMVPSKNRWDPPRSVPVPLTSVDIIASVVHAVAQVQLTQIFVNKEEQPIEAIYYFPVDSNGGVTQFLAELEGKTIKGVIKPQEEAKEQFAKAVEAKQTAFIMESKKPDIFKVSIGFLKPGALVKIVIGYVTEVKNEEGSNALRFFLPTTVAPRYIPPTETDKRSLDLKNMKFSGNSPAPLSIRVNVSLQGGIQTIESPTHDIHTVEMGRIASKVSWTRGVVELSGVTTDMDRDFVLLVTPEEVHIPRLYHEKFEDSTAVMAHLIPSFKLDEQKVELVFILDRSGSMCGMSMELAKKALLLFLYSAPADCYFNIVGFGSTFKFLFPSSVKYDDDTLKKAVDHASSLEADLGGTELFQPLKAVYGKSPIAGYLRQIFVLTDGQVFNTEQVIGLIKAHAHGGRVFCLGIGDSSSHHLVEGLSDAGGGIASFVGYKEKMDTKVLHQLKNACQPSLMDVEVTWTGIRAQSVSPPLSQVNKKKTLLGYGKPIPGSSETQIPGYSQVPKKIPPVYDGSQLLVFGLFPDEIPTGVVIKAQSPDGPLSLEIKLDDNGCNDLGSTGMIHKLAAVKFIRELELEIVTFEFAMQELSKAAMQKLSKAAMQKLSKAAKQNAEETKKRVDSLKTEIIQLSIKNGVGSKYTSFLAVDSESGQPTNDNWVMQTRHVASQVPYGYGGGGNANALRKSAPVTGGVRMPPRKYKKLNVHAVRKCAPGVETGGGNTSSSDESEGDNDSEDMEVDSDAEEDDFSEEEKVGNTTKDPLEVIVLTQSFNGSFPLTFQFAAAICVELKDLEKVSKSKKWDTTAFATAVAIAYLEQKLGEFKASWEMISAKGRKWLEKNFPKECAAILTGGSAFVTAMKSKTESNDTSVEPKTNSSGQEYKERQVDNTKNSKTVTITKAKVGTTKKAKIEPAEEPATSKKPKIDATKEPSVETSKKAKDETKKPKIEPAEEPATSKKPKIDATKEPSVETSKKVNDETKKGKVGATKNIVATVSTRSSISRQCKKT